MTRANGQLLIDKASGLTSHDVVARVRKLLSEQRVGHAGTLDPMASGLLILGVGASTRLLRFAQAQVKRYSGEVTLGVATDSLDADGVVVATSALPALNEAYVNDVARAMLGAQLQTPPMVSARRVDGQRLYNLARQGLSVEREARPVTIESFMVCASEDPARWHFEVTCSVGTYVRVLLSDLAERLGTLGHLSALRREASGAHEVHNAWTLEELGVALDEGRSVLRPPVAFVDELEQVRVDAATIARLRQGQRVELDTAAEGEVAVLDVEGDLVAIVVARAALFKPEIVMPDDSTKR